MNTHEEVIKLTGGIEKRSALGAVECRAEGEGPRIVYGEGVVFNTWTTISYRDITFMEMILPSALDGCDMRDVVSCRDHEMSLLCSRTTGNSDDLTISVDGTAARYQYTPKNECAKRMAEDIDLGFVKGSSFIFESDPDKGSKWERTEENGKTTIKRTITKIDRIIEMGGVTFQAYPTATISARSLQIAEELALPADKRKSGEQIYQQLILKK